MRIIERWSAMLLFFFLAALALILSIYKPHHNWDIIGYIASAKYFEQQDIEALHSFTYGHLKDSLPAKKYQRLVQDTGDGYRPDIYADPTAFEEQLPFYQVRIVYSGLIYLLYKTGVNIVFATHIVSGFAVAAAVVVLYQISVSYLLKPLIYAVPPLAVLFGILSLARHSTPDGLAFFAFTAAVYLYLKQRFYLILILLPILVAIRTDLILFVIPFQLLIIVIDKSTVWKTALSMIVSVAVYFSIGVYFGNSGWATVYYFVFIQHLTHPISKPATLTVGNYFSALLRGTFDLLTNQAFILYSVLAAYSLYLIKVNARTKSITNILKSSPPAGLTVVCLFYVVSHFLAYPAALDRYFTAAYLTGAFAFLLLITDYLKSSQSGLYNTDLD